MWSKFLQPQLFIRSDPNQVTDEYPSTSSFPFEEMNESNTEEKRLNPKIWITNGLKCVNKALAGSDAATACGLNPYMSMLELWMIKTGRTQPEH